MNNTNQYDIYAHVDENGILEGWYNTDVFDLEDIPTPRIQVSESQWQIAQEFCHNKVLPDGTTDLVETRSAEEISRDEQEFINLEARDYLSSTDWYVVRFTETGTPIPQDVIDARQAARDAIVELD